MSREYYLVTRDRPSSRAFIRTLTEVAGHTVDIAGDFEDPDDYLNRATEDFIDLTVDKVGTRFPGFTGAAITTSYAGCYDVTPDWNPVISASGRDGLFVAAGFSGHGFKIAPAVGRLVADLVVDGRRPRGWPLDRDPWPLESSVPGVFVAGDVRADSVKRVASAVGDGAMAVTLAHRYLGTP